VNVISASTANAQMTRSGLAVRRCRSRPRGISRSASIVPPGPEGG